MVTYPSQSCTQKRNLGMTQTDCCGMAAVHDGEKVLLETTQGQVKLCQITAAVICREWQTNGAKTNKCGDRRAGCKETVGANSIVSTFHMLRPHRHIYCAFRRVGLQRPSFLCKFGGKRRTSWCARRLLPGFPYTQKQRIVSIPNRSITEPEPQKKPANRQRSNGAY